MKYNGFYFWMLLHIQVKPNNYTESCMINEADGWR